jgi:Flp pilus assembly protein protease CpaA
MELLLIRQAIVLAASAIAAVTDWKTGYVYDWLTYPLIVIGIALNVLEQQWLGLALGIAVFVFGYAFYFAGKIGGGDVKQFTGIALVLPFFSKGIFLINALFIGAMLAVVFYTAFFATKYLLKKGLRFEENKNGIKNACLFAIALALYFFLIFQMHALSLYTVVLLGIPILFGMVFVALERGIRKEFFLKRVKLKDLEEDELAATEFESKKVNELLDLKLKGVLGKQEIEKLKKAKIESVLIYSNVPRFAPFFFLGSIIAMQFPNLLQLLFLRL